jgi:hypothetical protein
MMKHRNIKTVLVYLLLCSAALGVEPATKAPNISKSIRADIKLMWQTVPLSGEPGRKASSSRAIEAAHRVFMAVSLVGMSQEQVIQLLGDPKKSSDSMYNFPFYPTAKEQLVYRFDTGDYGWQFDLTFDEHDRVSKMTPHGIQ